MKEETCFFLRLFMPYLRGRIFSNRGDLYRHRILNHLGELPQCNPEQALAVRDDPEFQQEFRVNHSHIYRGHNLESYPAVYSFSTFFFFWREIWMRSMTGFIPLINRKPKHLSWIWYLSYMLRSVTTGPCRYYIPYQNKTVFSAHISISVISDFSVDAWTKSMSETTSLSIVLTRRGKLSAWTV